MTITEKQVRAFINHLVEKEHTFVKDEGEGCFTIDGCVNVAAALESALSAAKPISSIVPDHCSGTALVFDGGCLHVRTDGSGHIVIDEDDFTLEDDRREGEHGPEGSVHWIARFPAGEMTALRDFLNGQNFPAPPAPSVAVKADLLRKIANTPISPESRRFTDTKAQNEVIGYERADWMISEVLCALSVQVQDVVEERYRHKKRGSTYTVIARSRLQVDGDLDNEKVVVYRGEDGQTWVRPEYEFNDGRFEPLPAAPAKQDDAT